MVYRWMWLYTHAANTKRIQNGVAIIEGSVQRSCQILDLVGYAAHIHQVMSLAITFLL